MIVLDEQLKDHHLIAAIASWYPGMVTHIQALRPKTVVKDDNVVALLLTVSKPTFVTINVTDFWQKIEPHPEYCILTVDLLQGDVDDLSAQLRLLFNTSLLKTKAMRMGIVIRAQENRIRFYERDRQTLLFE